MSASTSTRDVEATIRGVIDPRVAERATAAPLRRGARARASTDSIVPSRAGYPTATLVSWEPDTKLQSNYHLPTDVPEHVRYDTVATAVTIAEAVARELGA